MKTINAQNQVLGRLATEIAKVLLGKDKADYAPNKITGTAVKVVNVNELAVSGSKMENKDYFKHTGYTGHLRATKMKHFSKAELLKKAVWNMLPKNKLRKERFKLLTIE